MQNHNPDLDPDHQKRLILAVVISTIIMGLWYYFYQMPIQEAQRQQRAIAAAQKQEKLAEIAKNAEILPVTQTPNAPQKPIISREEIIAKSPRIKINNGSLHGSIRLIGARIDDVTLAHYKETLNKKSPEVALMSPSGAEGTNFIDIGWIAQNPDIKTPNSDSLWQVEAGTELTPTTPVTISWDNQQGQKFYITYSIDADYMLDVKTRIHNYSASEATFFPFGLISKAHRIEKADFIQHTGPLGVLDGTLTEIGYDDLRENPTQEFANSTGWFGITDKYWFKSFIPQHGEVFKAGFRHHQSDGSERFQLDYLGTQKTASANSNIEFSTKIFIGAKELKILDKYQQQYNITLFERAIDFGWFYFITKPLYNLLIIFHSWVGNFGVAIMVLTFFVKLCLFPLARKSYISMGRLKQLQPKTQEIQKRYKDNKVELQKHLMDLYRKEKVNPAAGCLPILLQIPIFFSLYKVFFVSIEMRHAPFFGWIKDLSVQDPTSIFNAFGLLPYDVPSFLVIGIFPILVAVTMHFQQMLQPTPSDEMTAKMLKVMPIVFMVICAASPAGIVIYWFFSNIFTILQQLYFLRRHPRD